MIEHVETIKNVSQSFLDPTHSFSYRVHRKFGLIDISTSNPIYLPYFAIYPDSGNMSPFQVTVKLVNKPFNKDRVLIRNLSLVKEHTA